VNSTPQLDLHPDAESLNAFAEQALAAQEREQILAHLAGCSRCRQVIFLAQQAAADAQVPARVPAAQVKVRFWNWRFVWVPAAALAAALALVVTFYPRHTAPASEMAKAVPPSDTSALIPVPQEQVSAGATHKPALTAKSAAGNADYAERRMTTEKLAQEPAPSVAPPAELGANEASTGVSHAFLPSSVESAPQSENATKFQPEPAVAAWQMDQQQSSGGALSASADASRQISQKSMRAEAYTAHASRQVASSGPRMVQQSQSIPASSFEIGKQQQLAGASASLKAIPPRLPSGLAVVSRATAQHLLLEIDLAGTLFLSGDSGQHWEPVAQQWTGRAIKVRAKTGLSGNTAPATGFELQNDAGSIWSSADGKTWTAQ
jgi:hypothetical protein